MEQRRGDHNSETRRARVGIVGTGFSGLGMAIRLKRAGMDDFVVFERAGEIGGTWRDNTYPGCQCDVPSHLYSFSFRLNPNWTRTYSPQPEIFEYLRETVRDENVLSHILFRHKVEGAAWDSEKKVWNVDTDQGSWELDVLVSANGGLAEPAVPPLEGLDEFEGDVWHSASWNKNSDLNGKKVAVIGTGASAIQIVPAHPTPRREPSRLPEDSRVGASRTRIVRPRHGRESSTAVFHFFSAWSGSASTRPARCSFSALPRTRASWIRCAGSPLST